MRHVSQDAITRDVLSVASGWSRALGSVCRAVFITSHTDITLRQSIGRLKSVVHATEVLASSGGGGFSNADYVGL